MNRVSNFQATTKALAYGLQRVSLLLQLGGWNDADRRCTGFNDGAES